MNNKAIVTSDILDEKFHHELSRVNTGILAKIDTYYKSKRKAKVQPLVKIKTKSGYKNYPVVILPVMTDFGGMEIIPDYKAGDIVYLGGNVFQTFNMIRGQLEVELTSKHKLENMVIIGGFKKQPSSLSTNFVKDGLIITDNNFMFAQFSSNKIEFSVGSTDTQKSLLGEDTIELISDLIDAILDAKVMTPVGPSSPISALQTNLTKFNLLKSKLISLLSTGVKHN
jgi:hypothetical protein